MKCDYALKTISREKAPLNSYDVQFQIPHLQFKTIISYCLITISIKTCSFVIFNSVVLSNFMSDFPILTRQFFFPNTICPLTVVDVNTSYGS